MPKPKQTTLQHEIVQAEKSLAALGREYGKQSPQYQRLLVRLRRLWAVLTLTRAHSEFFKALGV